MPEISARQVKAGVSEVLRHPQQGCKFEANLGSRGLCLKKKKKAEVVNGSEPFLCLKI